MFGYPFVLADPVRVEQYAILSSTPNLFREFEVWRDQHGIVWARTRHERHCFAVAMLGPNWVFNAHLQRQWADDLANRRSAMEFSDESGQLEELSQITQRLRLHHNSERLVWAIHQWVLRSERSVVNIPDNLLARAIWGWDDTARPRNWRKTLVYVLRSLAKFHIAVWPDDGEPLLGQESAILTFAQDMLGSQGDRCDDDCPWFDGPRHSHFRVIIGPAFLGVLDQFARQADPSDPRTYDFRLSGPTDKGPTLRSLGKAGRLVSVYLPAKIGDRAACSQLSSRQSHLLQVIVRETTRNTTGTRHDMTEAAVFVGNEIQGLKLKDEPIRCPQLEAGRDYVGFNGGGANKGLGFGLTTPGGWLGKAGGGIREFLDDLAVLSKTLGLIPVGIRVPNKHCFNLRGLRSLARRFDHDKLAEVRLRIYTEADYVQRWNKFFGWPEELPASERGPGFRTQELIAEMKRKGITQRALARAIGMSTGFVGKVLRGRHRWQVRRLKQAQEWVAAYEQPKPTRG